jgi:hypothetical protein
VKVLGVPRNKTMCVHFQERDASRDPDAELRCLGADS